MKHNERTEYLAKQPFYTVAGAKSRVGFFKHMAVLLKYFPMLMLFIRRDIKSRYKDSVLGFLWSLVRPITQFAIYYFVVGKVLGAQRAIPDFAIYIFAGLTLYGLFSEIVSGGAGSIIASSGLIKKIYLPRELFPLTVVGYALFNFFMQLIILFIAIFFISEFSFDRSILYFFSSVMIVVIWSSALAILFSAWTVYLRDIQHFVEIFVILMMWASPIVYSWKMIVDLKNEFLTNIYLLNPVTVAIMGFQKALWSGADQVPYPSNFRVLTLIALLAGVIFFYFSQRIFARLQGNFAQML